MLRGPDIEKLLLEQLKVLLAKFPGTIPIYVTLNMAAESPMRLKLAEGFKIDPKQELLDALHQLLGEDGVVLKRQVSRPAQPLKPFYAAGQKSRAWSSEE